jgi:hypothetical protein
VATAGQCVNATNRIRAGNNSRYAWIVSRRMPAPAD